ncbi:MAG: aminodeoxychorismate/anthranilate synthase component II [Syntrophorhabdaceae bacterium]|nr:aminodeoxychorismate/anthranilate synthase component II [Syntrophorhabdaceae bacterium]
MLLLIDNYDSFTYNLFQYFGELGEDVLVFRNDEVTISDIERLSPDKIVISPGPCTPEEAGISVEAVRYFADKVPILGVCLGHQSIGYAFGIEVVQAKRIVHGKTSLIFHDGKTIFEGCANPFYATRYHSLALKDGKKTREIFHISALSEDGEIMGIRHKHFHIEGVQFHPESILTEEGKKILGNFLKIEGGLRSDDHQRGH